MIEMRAQRFNFVECKVTHFVSVIACAFFLLLGFASDAYAQSCRAAQNTVRQIERNRDFRNLNSNTETAQKLGGELAQLERAFVRAGCQQTLNEGNRLSRQCQTAARQITRGRSNLQTLERLVNSGRALVRQRDQLIAQLNSGSCSSSATTQTQSRNIFEQIFDALNGNNLGAGEIAEDSVPTYFGNTVRSVCVRVSDGYYWPLSYSTVPDYLSADQQQCQAMCPNTDVDLYYYKNPGQGPNDMVNLNGSPYTALPSAFGYRTSYDVALKCNVNTQVARIDVVDVNGDTRPMMTIDELTLPLPLRDPRNQSQARVVLAAEYVAPVPLPRKRPNFEAGETQVRAVIVQAADVTTIEVGGKTVRLVGAETPYIQLAAADS